MLRAISVAALQVVLRAGRDLAERHLFGRAAAQQDRELFELALLHQVAILGGSCIV